tara:strand:+ start:1561 stop:2217 length:657 start_codon:yes stop_codon:yes gene_type:complete
MGFNMNAAISGAGSGAALGPYGAIAGGLLGGFMGGQEPELYSEADYKRDMAPYMEMLEKQQGLSASMMERGSAYNRRAEQDIMTNTMDQMALANTMAGRQNAQMGGGIGNSGLLGAMTQQNLSNYSAQGLDAVNKNFQQTFGQGAKMQQNVTNAFGDYYGGLADLNAANIGTMNAYNQSQSDMLMEGMGGLMGNIAGAKFTPQGGTEQTGWGAWLSKM